MTDARERLRAYLEQRRELGEHELVLDGMSVDEVLRIVGAPAGGRPAVAPTPRATQARSAAGRDADAIGHTPAVAQGDWRSVLGSQPPEAPRAPVAPVNPVVAEPAEPARETVERRRPRAPSPAPKGIDAPAGIVVGSSERALFGGQLDGVHSLEEIAALTRACTACGLHAGARQAVPGTGNPNADFVCVGEAPGQTEDETGLPFVGRAGDLLEKILLAIGLTRRDVFICNVIKHRPPGNRNPSPDEVTACSPFLRRQLELLQPKVILALGTFAAQTLLDTKTPISKLRGAVHRYYGVPLVATYHPAALLRNPSWKRPTWEDVQLARRILDRATDA